MFTTQQLAQHPDILANMREGDVFAVIRLDTDYMSWTASDTNDSDEELKKLGFDRIVGL